jgi:hypothetical protein
MLQVEIVKRADGAGVLRCTRADGSVTWQKQRQGAFFALHDLTHFAVETTLGLRHGFFGLIDEGWEIDETDGKGHRGGLPPDAMIAEWIVGLLDAERASAAEWTAEEFRAGRLQTAPVTDEDLRRIQDQRRQLFKQWAGVEPGSVLKLIWEATRGIGAS